MKRTLLMLGGADIQVTAIQKTKELGYRVVTCDYLPENPGHRHADACYNVSTTDLDAVLDVAQREGISGISAYASDPAAVTAAYVAEQMGLPGNSCEATVRIQDKTTFRALQHALGLPAPRVWKAKGPADLIEAARQWPHGGIIKPVDTSGSKGVHRLGPALASAGAAAIWQDAVGLSRAGRVVVEEYLPRSGRQMTGDALIHDGRVLFWCFGDVHFNDRINGLVPRGVTVPGTVTDVVVNEAMQGVQQLVDALGLKQGVFNIDIFQDVAGRPIIVDIGARNGGNMLNTLYHLRTGVDLMTISLQQCMGDPFSFVASGEKERFVAHHVVHALVSGTLRGLRLSGRVAPYVFHRSFNHRPGDRVGRFIDSRFRLGLLLFEFPSMAEMQDVYAHIHDHVIVDVEPELCIRMTVEVPNSAPQEPLVSVVTATYQHAAYIERNNTGVAVQCVGFPVEHLIGEDESNDGTRAICQKLAGEAPQRIRLFLRERKDVQHRMGRPTARANITDLYTAARGRYIAVCPGDDHWIDPDKLRLQVELMEAKPHLAGCFTNAWNDRDGVKEDYLLGWLDGKLPAPETDLRTLVRRNFIPSATFLFRRDLLFPLPPAFFDAPVSDWVLVCHLARSGPLGYIDRHTAGRTIHAGGLISQRDLLHKLEVNLLTLEHIGRMVGPSCADVVAQRTTELLDQSLAEARARGRWKEAYDLWHRRIRHLAQRPLLRERLRWWVPAHVPALGRLYHRLRGGTIPRP